MRCLKSLAKQQTRPAKLVASTICETHRFNRRRDSSRITRVGVCPSVYQSKWPKRKKANGKHEARLASGMETCGHEVFSQARRGTGSIVKGKSDGMRRTTLIFAIEENSLFFVCGGKIPSRVALWGYQQQC